MNKTMYSLFARAIYKSIAMVLLSMCCIMQNVVAQSMPYSFVYTTNTYSALSSPTVVSSGVTMNDATFSVTLPFSFRFNGTLYSQIYLSENGYVSFGTTNPGTTTNSSISSSNSGFEVAAPFSADLQGSASTSQLSYLTSGTSPNRIFTAEWKNMRFLGGTGQTFSFQVLLKETTNIVEFKYSTVTNTGTAGSAQVGLRGANNSTFLNRTTTSSWSSTTAGTANSATCAVSGSVVPAVNTLFRFTPIPTVSVSGSMSAFGACTGAPSAQQSFTVSGYYLSGNVSVSAPANFQVSTTSGSGFTNSVTLTQTGGIVNATTIYVRMSSSFGWGGPDSISVASNGAATKKVGVAGSIERLNVSDIFVTPGSSGVITATGGTTYTWAPVTGLNATTGATVIATPSATTVYTVSGTTTGGCTDIAIVQVAVVNSGSTYTGTYSYTGRSRSFVVPSCVSQMTMTAKGAKGSNGTTDVNLPGTAGTGALGGTATGTATVTPGQVYYVFVGGAAVDTVGGFNGGGNGANLSGAGGGASDIRINDATITSRILVAGGGGGGGNTGYWTTATNGGNGGAGGGGNGTNGASWTSASPAETLLGGRGGTAATGGAGGDGCPLAMGSTGGNGSYGYGGNGGKISFYAGPSTTPPLYRVCGGGGGGGYIGGGGGGGGTYGTSACSQNYSTGAGGGAGGSNYVDASLTGTTSTSGTGLSGNGEVTISFTVGTSTPVNAGSDVVIGSGGSTTLTATGGVTYTWSPATGLNATTGASVVASPTTTTIYTVTGTNASGCTATDDVQVSVGSNMTPTYILSSPQLLTVCRNAGPTDISSLLHVNDTDASQTLAWTQQSAPAHGTLTFTSASASSGSTNITPGGTITYQPSIGYSGADVFTIRVSDGAASSDMVVNVSVTAISTSISSQTNVSCNGGSNGAVTVSASGGTGTLSYSWTPSGGSAATATGLTASNYTCTVTDVNSCSATQTVTVTQPTAITSSISSQTNVSCNGGSNGTVTVSASGGTGTLSYLWAPSGGTAATVTGLTAGAYTCTITDANSCSRVQTVTVTQPSAISTSVSSQTNVSCNGGSNGAVTVTASGGTGALSYSWSPSGGSAATATGIVAGTYTCTITDANSCSGIQTVTVTQPLAITSSISSQTNVSCNGGSNGAVTVTASGGTGALSYSWSPSGGTAATATGLVAGTYTCTITDANTCSRTQTANVTQPSTSVSVSLSTQTNVTCLGAATGQAIVTATGGTGTLSYSWSPASGTTSTANALTAGTYTCTVTDANGCSAQQTVNITQPATGITTSISSLTNVSCNGGSNGTATISASGGTGTLSYSWAPSGGTAATASGLAAGTYSCTVSDASTCSRVQTVTVTQPAALASSISSQANVSCNGGSNATVTVSASGGTGTLSYSWSPSGGSSATAAGLSVGNYTCTITDANTCSRTQTVTVTQPAPLTSSISSQVNVSCNGGSNGSATVSASGGAGTLSYSWSPSGGTAATATGLAAGNYTCTITDANTCSHTQTVTVTQPTALTSSISSQTNVSCNGGNNGSVEVSASGGSGTLSYSWFPSGGTAAIATELTGGTYTCTVTDANMCSRAQTVTIIQPVALTAITSSSANITCHDGNNGTAVISVSGGTAPYGYSWSPAGGSTSTATSLTAGSYTCTVTDALSCSYTHTVALTEPATVPVEISGTATICNNTSSNVTISSDPGNTVNYSINGGTPIATVIGASGTNIIGTGPLSSSATYSLVSVTSGTCTYSASGIATVSVHPLPTVDAITPVVSCNLANVTGIDFSGPVTGTTFTWANDNTTIGLIASGTGNIAAFTGVNSGTVASVATITVTPIANGCPGAEEIFTIKIDPTPVAGMPVDDVLCHNEPTGAYTFSSTVSGTTFAWTNSNTSIGLGASGVGSIPSFAAINTSTATSSASVIVTPSANGCTGVPDTFVITVHPKPELTSALTVSPICDNALFSYAPTSTTPGTIFSWSRAAISGIANVAASGTGNPLENLDNTSSAPVNVNYVYILTASACADTQNVNVLVYPTPSLTSTHTAAPICDGSLFNYVPTSATPGVTFTWSRDVIGGIANVAATGIGTINEILDNTTPNPVVVTYTDTLRIGGCSNTQTVTVTVNPTPQLLSTTTPSAVCDGTVFNYLHSSATAGTTFSWYRPVVTGISNPSASGTGTISETLDNTQPNPLTVIYYDTLKANGCSNVHSISLIVNPTPVLTSALTGTVCDSALYSYVPASLTAGTTFTWSRAAVAGVSNPAATGTGALSEHLFNTTAFPVNVIYADTLRANGCLNTQNVIVAVNPSPKLSTATVATFCSGTPFTYTALSATPGTTFSWTRAGVGGIVPLVASGTGTISETLTNTTKAQKETYYRFMLTANGCSEPQDLTVTVDPKPQVPEIAIHPGASLCGNTLFQNFGASTPAPDSVAYNWTAVNAIIVAQGAGHQYSLVSFNAAGAAEVILTANVPSVTCFARDTFKVNVSTSISHTPALIYFVNENLVCGDNEVDGYQWGYDDINTLDSVIFPGQIHQHFHVGALDVAHKLYWVMTTKDGCSQKTYYNTVVGVQNVDPTIATIKVYPNPANGIVKMELTGVSFKNTVYDITDMAGRKLAGGYLEQTTTYLDVTGLAPGLYMISVYDGGGKAATIKLVRN